MLGWPHRGGLHFCPTALYIHHTVTSGCTKCKTLHSVFKEQSCRKSNNLSREQLKVPFHTDFKNHIHLFFDYKAALVSISILLKYKNLSTQRNAEYEPSGLLQVCDVTTKQLIHHLTLQDLRSLGCLHDISCKHVLSLRN